MSDEEINQLEMLKTKWNYIKNALVKLEEREREKMLSIENRKLKALLAKFKRSKHEGNHL